MTRLSLFITIIISLLYNIPSFSQQVVEMDEQKYIARKFETLDLFDKHLKISKNDQILICHQSEMNQDGGRFFKTVYRQFDYINPSASRKLSLSNDIGLFVTIDYFFLLKASNDVYAKIKYVQENGQTLKWVVNVLEALSYDEIQVPNSALISQYDLFKELLHTKPKIDENDVEHYIRLFDPVTTEGKNEFQIKKITDAAKVKCDSLKRLSIVGNEYFEFNRSTFDKYDFEKKGMEITIKTQFEYRLEPQSNRASSLMGYDKTPNVAIISFSNLRKKKTQKELEALSAAFKMGVITMEEFNSRMSGANSNLFLAIDPNEGEKVITKIDSLLSGRQFYVLYNFEVANSKYSTYGAGRGSRIEVDANLNTINLYYDPNRTMLFRSIVFNNQNIDKNEVSTEEKDDENKIFEKVEIEASFKGGEAAWKKYLERNLNSNVPVDNGAPKGTYTVYVQFVVSKDGNISDVRALTSHGYGMEQEAIKIIKKGPTWVPAVQNGHNVKAYHKVPITFVGQ